MDVLPQDAIKGVAMVLFDVNAEYGDARILACIEALGSVSGKLDEMTDDTGCLSISTRAF